MSTISFNVQDTVGEIVNQILQEFKKVLNSALKGSVNPIKKRTGDLVKDLITRTPEFSSLINGRLRAELGLEFPQYALIQVLDQLQNSVRVHIDPLKIVHEEIEGGLIVDIVQEDHSDILRLPAAKYNSGQYVVPWLEWLLTAGDALVIADYGIRYNANPKSRSGGGAIMFHSKKRVGWKVPSQYSGIIGNNFITRAFDSPFVEQLMFDMIKDEITARIF